MQTQSKPGASGAKSALLTIHRSAAPAPEAPKPSAIDFPERVRRARAFVQRLSWPVDAGGIAIPPRYPVQWRAPDVLGGVERAAAPCMWIVDAQVYVRRLAEDLAPSPADRENWSRLRKGVERASLLFSLLNADGLIQPLDATSPVASGEDPAPEATGFGPVDVAAAPSPPPLPGASGDPIRPL